MTKKEVIQETFQDETLSSGVTVRILPFPTRLWLKIGERAEREHPDPDARKVMMAQLLGDALLDFCIQVDLAPWEGVIKRLEKYDDQIPTDPDERRVYFLTNFALRGRSDYERILSISATLMGGRNGTA